METELHNGNENIDDKLWVDFWENLESILGAVKKLESQETKDPGGEVDLKKIELSHSLIDAMKEDVNSGMLMELDQYFSEIEKIGPDGEKLTDLLKELAGQFADEEILDKIKTNSASKE